MSECKTISGYGTKFCNHPLVPILVYEFYRESVRDKEYFGKEKPINRNQWAWSVIECKKYVVKHLGVPEEDEDIIFFEDNTIEAILFTLFSLDGRTFKDGAVPDLFVGRED